MSYREFWRPVSKGRLTDQQWRRMTVAGEAPPAPAWLRPFVAGDPKPLGDWVAEERSFQKRQEQLRGR